MHCPATDPAAAVQLAAVIVPTSHTYYPLAFHPLTWLVRCADMAAARHTAPCGICVCLLSDTWMYACMLVDACMLVCAPALASVVCPSVVQWHSRRFVAASRCCVCCSIAWSAICVFKVFFQCINLCSLLPGLTAALEACLLYL
jgi:hypothetical protein